MTVLNEKGLAANPHATFSASSPDDTVMYLPSVPFRHRSDRDCFWVGSSTGIVLKKADTVYNCSALNQQSQYRYSKTAITSHDIGIIDPTSTLISILHTRQIPLRPHPPAFEGFSSFT